jgi:hypothetical protein
MARLVPCLHCFRHIRVGSVECPFCQSAVAAVDLGRQAKMRGDAAPVGAKRATLFALGASLAAACGAKEEPTTVAPGPSTDTLATSSADALATSGSIPSSTSQGTYSVGSSTANTTTVDTTTELIGIPIYGAPPTPSSDDMTSTEGVETSTPGIDTTPTSDIDTTTSSVDAGDGGHADAGTLDGGEFTIPPDEPDPDPGPVPVYGAPPSP